MNCEQFREMVDDVARDEGLGISALNEALEHADRCDECDALLNEAEALTANLSVLAARHANEVAPARVEAALLRSFRESRAPASSPSRLWLWSFTGLGGAVAAALLMMVLMQNAKHVSTVPTQVESADVSAAQPGDGISLSEEADSSFAADLPADLTEGWPVAFDDGAASGSFTPLTEAFDPTSLDMNAVVRVSMSRLALQNLGVYLDAESNEPVVADLVVSNDGTPQAIRVVSW
jgi:hypothetical protein